LRRLLAVPSIFREALLVSVGRISEADVDHVVSLSKSMRIRFMNSEIHLHLDSRRVSASEMRALVCVYNERYIALDVFQANQGFLVSCGIRKCDVRVIVVADYHEEDPALQEENVRKRKCVILVDVTP
jgi:hypothetical protein